ncbi:hypothetical protein F2Q69_00048432 [Brassica cretica]|uniref:Uncharacterized protein n=1 Tax=Brassica cretica TaxID=69181 RepID=A0A8S9Q1H3_BRACR|nr:hypothetical protein F2Q69_00048432 [Brassica cretica]
MGDVGPSGYRHSFFLFQGSVLEPAPVSIPGVLDRSLGGSFIPIFLIRSGRLLVLLRLGFSAASDAPVLKQAPFEGRDRGRDAALGNCHLLLVEADYVVSQEFYPMLKNLVEPSEVFSRLLLLANYSTNLSLSFAGHFLKCNHEHPLLVLSDKIVGVACTVVYLYAGEGKLPRHLDRDDSFHEGGIGVGVRVTPSDWGGLLLVVMEDSVADIFSGVSLSYFGSESLSSRLWTGGFSAPSRVAPETPDARA